MSQPLKAFVRKYLSKAGYHVEKIVPADLPDGHAEIYASVKGLTMTSALRISSFISSVDYVSRAGIEGDIVECGVWRGGSMMAAATKLRELGDTSRTLHLFDTYEGMSEPTEEDVSVWGNRATKEYQGWADHPEEHAYMCYAGLQEVKNNLAKTGYPEEKLRYVQGKVEQTLPDHAPAKIAVLRLDTDWYESTLHELETLYPLLEEGGVLIIDDYGFWAGARKAVDEYLADNGINLLLSRIDGTGRLAIKPSRPSLKSA